MKYDALFVVVFKKEKKMKLSSAANYKKSPLVLKKIDPPKFFDKSSQGPDRDQPGTKIAINILVRY